jgi:hypothetical protein
VLRTTVKPDNFQSCGVQGGFDQGIQAGAHQD